MGGSSSLQTWSRSCRGQTEVCRVALRLVFRGGPNELEQVGSANSPLAVDRLYDHRHRQLRRHGTGGTSRLGGLLAAAPALPAAVHRPVHGRVALCYQVAQRETHCRTGSDIMVGRPSRKSAKIAKKAAA